MNPSQITRPALRVGDKVPIFYLPSADGGQSGPASTRSKYNLVLLFLPNSPSGMAYLREIGQIYPQVLRNDARVIAVVQEDAEAIQSAAGSAGLPFTLLIDKNGVTTARILGGVDRVCLCAADRYGVIYFVESGPDLTTLPPSMTILDWLEFIELQCPECTDANASPWFLKEDEN